MVGPRRFEVHLAALDPTIGSEIRKTRPCVVVSPDEANDVLNTVVVAPLTSTLRNYPTRILFGVVVVQEPGRVRQQLGELLGGNASCDRPPFA